MSRSRGFSLLEVLLAMTLLAAGLGLAFSTLRGATQATAHADEMAARSERLRAVQGFLRRQVAAAQPFPYDRETGTGAGIVFENEGDTLKLVSPMPGYLSRGGPYLQTFSLVRGNNGLRLEFEHQLLTPDGPIDAERPAEVLLDGIAEARFETRTRDEDGEAGDWQDRWDHPDRIPELVRLTLRFNDPLADFPTLVIAPRSGLSTLTARANTDSNLPGGDREDEQ